MNGVPKPIDAKGETDAAPQIVAGMTVGSDLLKKNDEAAKIDAVGSDGVGKIGARSSSQQTRTEAV